MIDASFFLTNNPFKTENKADKNDEIRAYIIPKVYWDSKLKIIYKPITTNKPKRISTGFILLLKKRGSIKEVKKAPVLIITNATETLETLIALKKVIQCNAMMIPDKKNLIKDLLSSLNDFFLTIK